MKVVSYDEWLKLPIGTVWVEYVPDCWNSPVRCKESSGEDDICLFTSELEDDNRWDDIRKEYTSMEAFKSFELQPFSISSRMTGCFSEKDKFLVFEKADLKRLAVKLFELSVCAPS